MTTKSFGAVLHDLRTARQISQSKLAEYADFDHSYVSRLESGDRMPSSEAVDRFADALGLNDIERMRLLHAAGFLGDGEQPVTTPLFVELHRLWMDGSDDDKEWIERGLRMLIERASSPKPKSIVVAFRNDRTEIPA